MALPSNRSALLALVLAACSPGAEPSPSWPAGSPPHIVVILADDLGWGDVGFHGSAIETPALDRLARESLELTAHYALPLCTPSRVAFLTGRYPMRCGMQECVARPRSRIALPLEERLLSEELQALGYETALTGKWHLGYHAPEYRPTARGFEHQYGFYAGWIGYWTHEREGERDWQRNDQPLEEEGFATKLIADEAVRRIEERDPERRLFLWVAFSAPHTPLQPRESDAERYAHFADPDRRDYAGLVASLDRGVARILEALDGAGMREETLVLFASDNGGKEDGNAGASNAPLRGGKGDLYEGGVLVPTLVRYPGHLPAGERSETPMHLVDWFPTFVTLAGGTPDEALALDGKDLWPSLTSGAPSPHAEILLNAKARKSGLRRGHWKLVAFEDPRKPADPLTLELYDLQEDPGEQRNLAEEQPAIAAELLATLEGYAREARRPMGRRTSSLKRER